MGEAAEDDYYVEDEDEYADDPAENNDKYNEEGNRMSKVASSLQTMLPPHTRVFKHDNNSTAFNQAHDVGKGHLNARKERRADDRNLKEGLHEHQMPLFAELLDKILTANKVPKSSHRTFFKSFINIEAQMDRAFTYDVLRKSYEKSGQGMRDIRTSLDHWAGAGTFKEADFDYLEQQAPLIADIIRAQGTCQKSAWLAILGAIIFRLNTDALSTDGLKLLTLREMSKPIEERGVQNYGASIISNHGFQESQYAKVQAKIVLAKQKLDASEMKRLESEIAANLKTMKAQEKEVSRLQKEALMEETAESVYDCFRSDLDKMTFDGSEITFTWKSFGAKVISTAYDWYIKAESNVEDGIVHPKRKKDQIAILEKLFYELLE